MTELTGIFGNARVDALTFLPSVITDIDRYQTEFANAIHGGTILDSVSLTDFLARQQFVPGGGVQMVLQKLQALNKHEFIVEGQKKFVASAPFVVHKQAVIHEIAKPLINALNTMKEHGTIDLQNMGYRDPQKMMLINVSGWMVGDKASYKGNEYLVAAINPYEKHRDTIFEKNKPLLLIDECLKKAVVVSPYEIVGDGSL